MPVDFTNINKVLQGLNSMMSQQYMTKQRHGLNLDYLEKQQAGSRDLASFRDELSQGTNVQRHDLEMKKVEQTFINNISKMKGTLEPDMARAKQLYYMGDIEGANEIFTRIEPDVRRVAEFSKDMIQGAEAVNVDDIVTSYFLSGPEETGRGTRKYADTRAGELDRPLKEREVAVKESAEDRLSSGVGIKQDPQITKAVNNWKTAKKALVTAEEGTDELQPFQANVSTAENQLNSLLTRTGKRAIPDYKELVDYLVSIGKGGSNIASDLDFQNKLIANGYDPMLLMEFLGNINILGQARGRASQAITEGFNKR